MSTCRAQSGQLASRFWHLHTAARYAKAHQGKGMASQSVALSTEVGGTQAHTQLVCALPQEGSKRRVVVTGMGVVSSLGHEHDEFYNNLLAGKSGVSLIEV